MKYDIYIHRLFEGDDYPDYGVEIIPPIGELAAQGVCRYLTQRPSKRDTNKKHVYETAIMTRNDTSGTALILNPNQTLYNFGYQDVAVTVETAINPTESENIEVVHHHPGIIDSPDTST